ncbi:YqiA/YcfP family alpha/beta fold hydrolase [Halarcobacter anaerophilus]|uniref:Esterase n=1 Tax=Halarcobacter anaerophilus TaxID=877500 RepID=A0A4Q0Y4T9_9BACT|nr:YqiA/YcfP family alpha/beta fold hydrolase [Halarcobacter anaerophilus]QDF29379.1 esterase (UPF0227 domain) [Halarcobacter anaerophilus]RXJ64625.1 esterase [Halarcobacter anaerophilus]
MIIYIHGFGSNGHSGKATLFREYFEDEVVTPSLSYVPNLAIDTLEQIIEIFLQRDEKVGLVGSSLGGYYAIYLANKYDLKAVLINPAIYPYKTLNKIGMQMNYYDGSSFEVIEEHMNELKAFEIEKLKNQENFMVLLKTDDEILDYNEAVEKLPQSELIIEEGGNHSFEDIESYFRKISVFLESKE